jgi:hypothetical protein
VTGVARVGTLASRDTSQGTDSLRHTSSAALEAQVLRVLRVLRVLLVLALASAAYACSRFTPLVAYAPLPTLASSHTTAYLPTTTYVPSYYYICVLILTWMCAETGRPVGRLASFPSFPGLPVAKAK